MIDVMDAGISGGSVNLKKTRREKVGLADTGRVDRLPPHSTEAEQGVLGCVMLSPNECVGRCIERLKGSAEPFYDLRHRTIYEVLMEMYDGKKAIDLITLQQELKNRRSRMEQLQVVNHEKLDPVLLGHAAGFGSDL